MNTTDQLNPIKESYLNAIAEIPKIIIIKKKQLLLMILWYSLEYDKKQGKKITENTKVFGITVLSLYQKKGSNGNVGALKR